MRHLLALLRRDSRVTEHATEYSSGSMLVWNEQPWIQEIYPTAQKIAHEQKFSTVWQRKILVLQDWTEVPKQQT